MKYSLIFHEYKDMSIAYKLVEILLGTQYCTFDIIVKLSTTSQIIRYLIDNCCEHIQFIDDQVHLIYAHKRISKRELEFYLKSFSRMDPKLLREVTRLKLANNGFVYDETFFELLLKLNFEKIKSFDISFNQIENVFKLLPFLRQWTNITELELANNNLNSVFVRKLLESNMPNLLKLGLSSNDIGIEGAKSLASGLKSLISLTDLNLDGCNIKEAGAISIAKSIGLCTGITSLGLCSNNTGLLAATEIISQCSQLVSLNLGFNMIGYGEDEQIKKFEHELNSLTNLTELNLRANNIKKLSGICEVFKNLILLDLSDNKFYNSDDDSDDDENDEINNLVSSLFENTSLLFLNLSENDIGPHAAERIVHALEKCTGLQSLDLSVNQINDSVGPIEEYCNNNFPGLRLYIDDNLEQSKRYF